ncbi:phosphoenolpyruvate--protein phosphotransferase [Pendulispora albinea]|uniref:Phosphoenolpyruvate-protein phosphotransferase n=1 Tax=Pendulispora albinea TaxID=2741071 RepID=A0ABZ2LUQ6_9BACT
MNVIAELRRIVEQSHSSLSILEAAVRVVAERMHAGGCSAFLLDEGRRLVPGAAHGPDGSGGSAAESIAARGIAERGGAMVRGEATSLLAAPMLVRDDVAGALVVQSSGPRVFSAGDGEALTAIGAQLAGIIEDARIIDALDRGEPPLHRGATRALAVPAAVPAKGEWPLHGVGASPGIAIGAAVFRGAPRVDLAARAPSAGEPEAQRARVRTAVDKVRNDLLRIQIAAEREIDEEHALIFASHLLLLNDSKLLERIDEEIASGLSAPRAIATALDEFESWLRLVPDAYIQEKVDDIDDLRNRLLDHLFEGASRRSTSASILVTSRVLPSLVVEMKSQGARALVTETGSETSHGVLLARAMGIPVVTGMTDMLSLVQPNDRLIVDGSSGLVIVRPCDETVARYEEERHRLERGRTEYAKFRDVLAQTSDGVRVKLHANAGLASDLTVARENGAEGIGLYRSEYPFIVRNAFPTRGEQVHIYSKAYELFPDGPIQFRILDLAGDKFVGSRPLGAGRSAFHGYRSIRVLFDHPDLLRDQVQALAIAAGGRPLRILIPMVTSIEELRRVKTMIRQALDALDEPIAQRAPQIGAMIEVPAAVELAADIAKEVDFLSIGTNDLMQYTLLLDREDPRMAQMSDPYHPAILRMIARVVTAAHGAGRSVGVCGEIASRTDVALVLIALGVDSLSVAPTAIPELKQALARARVHSMRRAVPEILALSDARSIAVALRAAQSA